MALPRAVQEQVARAEKIVEDLSKGPEPLKAVETKEKPAIEAVVEETPPVEEKPPVEDAAPVEDNFEQKYKVLQGKYNAEVPRLTRQAGQQQTQIDELRGVIASMQKPVLPTPSAPTAEATAPLFTPQEMEDYGDDFMDVVGRKATQMAAAAIEPLRQEIRQLQNQQNSTDKTLEISAQDKVLAELEGEVADWAKINDDPLFMDWLNKEDSFSGVERGRLLSQAFKGGKAKPVIAIFQSYLKENAAVSTDTSGPSGEDDSPKVDINTLVAPGKTRATRKVADAHKGKPEWTEQEVAAFYADCQRGKFKDDPKEQRRIEEDIFAAVREGRMQVNMQTPVSNAPY